MTCYYLAFEIANEALGAPASLRAWDYQTYRLIGGLSASALERKDDTVGELDDCLHSAALPL